MTIDLTRKKIEDYSAKQVFDIADAFLLAALRCDEPRVLDIGVVQRLMVPVIVNASFACELFLKSILIGNGLPPHKHELNILFDRLPKDTQDIIVNSVPEYDFGEEVEKISCAFTEWRYIYEIEFHSINIDFLFKLAYALRNTARLELEKML